MWAQIANWGVWVLAILSVPISITAAGHAVLYKRDVRASFAWAIFCLFPYFGPMFYFLFGINRVQRKAVKLRHSRIRVQAPTHTHDDATMDVPRFSQMSNTLDSLSSLVEGLSERPLLSGNQIEPLRNGDEAYPAMLKAIEEAQHSVCMESYIFDDDDAGKMFLDAFQRAVARGIEVRVLIDDMGRRYSRPPINVALQNAGIKTALFMPTSIPTQMQFINLRNHRKIMVVDGKIGFTGGINVRAGHVLSLNTNHPVQDLHFKLEGPIVAHLQETFAEDWVYTTGEILEGEIWFPPLEHTGMMLARGIPDGPDEDFDILRWAILGALSCARNSIRIATPYFLPDQTLITSLNLAAMRGVDVEILLPEKNNLPFVQWATTATLWQILERGCRIHLSSAPFDHTKLVVVDQAWSLFGSANWDPRSLRLNFEFNVECYDAQLATQLHELLGEKILRGKEIKLEDVNNRPVGIRLRDGIARLFSPYM